MACRSIHTSTSNSPTLPGTKLRHRLFAVALLALILGPSAISAQGTKVPPIKAPIMANPDLNLDKKIAPVIRLPAQSKIQLLAKSGIVVTPSGLGSPVQLTPRRPLVPGVAHVKYGGIFDSSLDFFLLFEGWEFDVYVKAAKVGKPILVTLHLERRGQLSRGQSPQVRLSSVSGATVTEELLWDVPLALSYVFTPTSTSDFQRVSFSAESNNVRVTLVELTPVL